MSGRLRIKSVFGYAIAIVFSALLTVGLLDHFAVASAPVENVVRAQSFQLLGKDGKAIAKLETDKNGEPELSFFDKRHMRRLSLFLESNGTPDLYFWDKQGHQTLAIDLWDSGLGNLAFESPDGKSAVIIDQGKDGGLAIHRVLLHPKGMTPLQTLKLFSGSGMTLQDRNGKVLWHSG